MTMMASGVQLNPELKSVLGQIAAPQSKNITDAYSKLRGGIAPTSDYATERFAKTGGLAQGNLESVLGGVLGNTSYGDVKNERDYQQNYELAKRIGELNAPSLLEQVLGGLGGGAQTGGQFAGLYNSLKKPPKTTGSGNVAAANDFYDTAFA